MAFQLPELFAKSSTPNAGITRTIIQKYRHLIHFPKNASIMEFGFAGGDNSEHSLRPILPEDYKEFVAVDISEKMVEYASKNVKIPRSKFHCLDTATPELPNMFKNRFDNIFSFMTFQVIKNPRQVFINIFKMLKDGGETFHVVFKHTPSDDVFYKMSKHPKWGKYDQTRNMHPYFGKPDKEAHFTADLKAAGFKNFKYMEDHMTYNFASEKKLTDLFLAVNLALPNIPADELEEYKEEYSREIRNLYTLGAPVNDPNHLVKPTSFSTIWAKKE